MKRKAEISRMGQREGRSRHLLLDFLEVIPGLISWNRSFSFLRNGKKKPKMKSARRKTHQRKCCMRCSDYEVQWSREFKL